MKVALLGDAHGDLTLLAQRVAEAAGAGAGAAIQLGDLGFREDLLGAGRSWPHFPIPVLAVDGNHEDHAFLRHARSSGLATAWAAHGLCYQARGSVARLGGRTVGFLGGAMHADRPQDADGGNLIAEHDVATALAAFAVRPPDLIATHACPCRLGIGMRGSPAMAVAVAQHIAGAGLDSGPSADCGEPSLLALWQGLAKKPLVWAFGHFHVTQQATVAHTAFVCLPELGGDADPVFWDSDTGLLTGP